MHGVSLMKRNGLLKNRIRFLIVNALVIALVLGVPARVAFADEIDPLQAIGQEEPGAGEGQELIEIPANEPAEETVTEEEPAAEEETAVEATAPTEESTSADETVPAEETASAEDSAPTEETAAEEGTAPAEAPAEENVPAEAPAPEEETAPAEAPTAEEETTPAEAPAPEEETAPAEDPAPAEESTPAQEPVAEQDDEDTEPEPLIIMIDPNPTEGGEAGGESEGNGSLRIRTITYQRPENVISMIVPVTMPHTYDFTLDPQGLLALSEGNTVIGEGSTVFFHHNGEENVYSCLSDFATAVNKSTVPVELTVTLQLCNNANPDVHFTGIGEVDADENMNLGFAIVPTIDAVVEGNALPEIITPNKEGIVATDANGFATTTFLLPGMLENYELVDLPTEEEDFFIQTYVEKEDVTWPVAGYALYGACSRGADWRPLAESLRAGGSLSLQVTYQMKPIIPEPEEDEADPEETGTESIGE